jgi:hypothetical protein
VPKEKKRTSKRRNTRYTVNNAKTTDVFTVAMMNELCVRDCELCAMFREGQTKPSDFGRFLSSPTRIEIIRTVLVGLTLTERVTIASLSTMTREKERRQRTTLQPKRLILPHTFQEPSLRIPLLIIDGGFFLCLIHKQ